VTEYAMEQKQSSRENLMSMKKLHGWMEKAEISIHETTNGANILQRLKYV
jgi:hypothetical protein